MTTAPFAPWELAGEAIACLARPDPTAGPEMPPDLVALPGPSLVLALRYTDTPVGPYLQLAVGRPARLDWRPGWYFDPVTVDRLDARVGARLNWGFPAEVGRLRWGARDDDRDLIWEDREVSVHAEVLGGRVPVVLPARAVQERSDGCLVVPGTIRGWARRAMVTIHTYPGDPLAPLRGRRPGLYVTGLQQLLHEGRQPLGRRATLEAPLRSAESALNVPPSFRHVPVLQPHACRNDGHPWLCRAGRG